MRLLVIAGHYRAFVRGLGDALAPLYDQVTVVIPTWRELRCAGLNVRVFRNVDGEFSSSQPNVSVRRISVPPVPFVAPHRIVAGLRRQNERPDVVLSHFIVPYGYLGNAVARRFGATSAVLAHGFDAYDLPFRNPFFRHLTCRILTQADRVLTVSRKNQMCLEACGYDGRIHVIGNGYDPSLFNARARASCRQALGLPESNPLILSVGNLVPIKNHGILVEAMPAIRRSCPDAALCLLGAGPLEQALRQRVKALGLDECVKLPGAALPADVALWMGASNVLALPSLNEGSPCVVYESLACGRPVVAASVGGVPELVRTRLNGLLVPSPADAATWGLALLEALSLPWDARSISAAVGGNTWEATARRLQEALSAHGALT